MNKGKVKWFNEIKGFGYICSEDGREAFVYYKDIAGDGFRTLFENEPVTFDLAETPRGIQAVNVVKTEEKNLYR
jgi:cold shock protein